MAISNIDWIKQKLIEKNRDRKAVLSMYEQFKDECGSTSTLASYRRQIYIANNELDSFDNALDMDFSNSNTIQDNSEEDYSQWTSDELYNLFEAETDKKGQLLNANDIKEICNANDFPPTLLKERWGDVSGIIKTIYQNLGLASQDKIAQKKLQNQIDILRKENSILIASKAAEEKVLEVLEDIVQAYTPFKAPKPYVNKTNHKRTAVALLSDWHVDETVSFEQMHGINEYSIDIAKERLDSTFDKIIENGKQFNLDTIYLRFLGDMISGNLHDLAENAEYHVIQQIITVADYTAQLIKKLSAHFKKIYCIGIAGNHSRLHKKPYFKNKNHMNFEFILYEFIKRSTENIVEEFIIPESPFIIQNIYGTNVLSLHGDQIRGGNGLNSVPGNLSRDISLLSGTLSSVGQSFEICEIAHFHSINMTRSFSGAKIIMNGSLIGGNEFSIGAVKKAEAPGQVFYVLDQEYPGSPRYVDTMLV